MMKNKLLLLTSGILMFSGAFTQLTLTPEPNDTTFIYSLAGPGIVVSNIERNCHTDASAFYNSTDANVGIENGILLSSGTAASSAGPNDVGAASSYLDYPGDTDLEGLTMWLTYDACAISFDMTVMADTVKLKYVFASEEYPEFTFSGFNDIFAFWVSGPGIPTPVNIATVPGTDLPVSINNINATTYSDYYIENGDGYMTPYSTDDYYIQFDGLTTVLEAKLAVTAGETYHMKMAIADASDGIYDSGVFLETGSLGSLRMHTDVFADNDLTFAVEKCASGHFTFTNEIPSAEPLVIDYMIGGSAINGVDYETIPEQLTIPAWTSEGTIDIVPIHDVIDESFESVILYLYNPQSGVIYDTVTMLIDDEPAAASFASTISDLSVAFTETSGAAVSQYWEFGDGTISTESNPTHIYATAGVYNVCVTGYNAYGCSDTYCDMVTVGNVDINDLQNTLSISPNPVANVLQLEGTENNAVINILNLQGEVVLTSTAYGNSVSIDVSALPAGIYTLRATQGSQMAISNFEKL
ncbi:MAG: choice-of-anchor L domain-containing protein [Chitinophagales bacterium]|nr:choice-of-anchor L domain-containing protein [Chitinophagales bacterium]